MAQLERAMEQVNLRLEHVRLLVMHARPLRPLGPGGADLRARRLRAVDAPQPRARRRAGRGPERGARRGGSRSGARAACPSRRCSATPSGARAAVGHRAGDRARPRAAWTGSRSRPTWATWQVYETPGHAPSHVCLFQPERRLLISGDHVLGRISLYYDYGWTPDPVGEFLSSLDVVEGLDARLVPVRARQAVRRRARPHRGQPPAGARAARRPCCGAVRGRPANARRDRARGPRRRAARAEPTRRWLLAETLCYLRHLERGRRGCGGWTAERLGGA